jgi:hypothetical protein
LKTPDSPDDDSEADETAVDGSSDTGVRVIQCHRHLYLTETVVTATALTIFCKAFVETLGRRAGESAANLLDRVRIKLLRKSDSYEYHLGVEGVAAAAIVVTDDLPDEAKLALLDLDVTADELRGKLLRWDGSASVWRPADDK